MATERIVIEFVGDTTELEPAIDQLTALGQIDQKSAAAFKATNKAIAERTKELQGLSQTQSNNSKAVTDTASKYEALTKILQKSNQTLLKGASSEVIKGFYEGIGDALDEAGISVDQFAQKLTDKTTQAEKPVGSLRAELRRIKDELASIDPDNAKFAELATEAAQLQKAIGDVNKEVQFLATQDTSAMEGVVQGVQGVTAAFQLAQGTAALFGEESENLQKVQLQLVALLNISNGLQQINVLLNRQSAAVLAIVNVQRNLQNLSLVAENALQSKNVVVKGLATAAQLALNAAMRANPIGLLVAGLAAVAGALLYFTRTAEDATESQQKLNEAQIRANEIAVNGLRARVAFNQSLDQQSGNTIKALETELALSKANGDSKLAQARIEKQIADARVAQAVTQIELNKENLIGRDALIKREQELLRVIEAQESAGQDASVVKSRLALVQDQIALLDDLTTALDDATQAQVVADASITTALAEEAKAREEIRKKELEQLKLNNLAKLEEEKAAIQTRILQAEEGSSARQKAELDLVAIETQIGLTQLDGVENVENQKNLIRQEGITKAIAITKNGEDRILQVYFDTEQKLLQSRQNLNDAALAQVEKNTQEEVNIKNAGLELQAEQQRLALERTFDTSAQTEADYATLSTGLLKIDAELYAGKEQNARDYQEFLRLQNEKILAEQEALNQQVLQGAIQVIGAITNATFASDKERRDNTLSLQLKTLNDQRTRELNNKKLTDDQKLEIEEKYRAEEAKLKLKAWQADKEAKLLQAIINTALGVTAALATGPAGYVLAAITAALGAVEIAAISSTQPPAFAKGVEFLHGKGTATSDSIPALLSRGERVMTAKTNKEYYPALSAIHNGKVSPDVANSLLGGFKYPHYDHAMPPAATFEMDYKKIGQSVAENIDMEELTEAIMQTGGVQAALLDQLNNNIQHTKTRSIRYR